MGIGPHGMAPMGNKNAFVGVNLGVPASPLEAITSMDPRDYVWGAPPGYGHMQQQAFPSPSYGYTNGINPFGSLMAPNAQQLPGMIQTPHAGALQPQHSLQSQGAIAPTTPSVPGSALPSLSDTKSDQVAAEAQIGGLEHVDDLLVDLDDDCMKLLQGGDQMQTQQPSSSAKAAAGQEQQRQRAQQAQQPASPSNKADGTCSDPSDNSAMTGEHKLSSKTSAAMDVGMEGFGTSDFLDGAEVNFGLDDVAGIRQVASFGDLDNDFLASIHELETASSHDFSFGAVADSGDLGAKAKRGEIMKRVKSEAAIKRQPSGLSMANPLLALSTEDALAAVNEFLAGDLGVADEKRKAALSACQALLGPVRQLSMNRGRPTVPKRKRSNVTRPTPKDTQA
ncbi:hypothetical protein WJX72_006333 [[Myrmecia] bisecta]|uniref:Uncharacterized protein n=1 Tax=[Myrmecia] bisecta TaxID=41462 RepID=A0AAW1R7A6_9CHLO